MLFVQFMAKQLYILCHSWSYNHAFCGNHDQKIMYFVQFMANQSCFLGNSRPNNHAFCAIHGRTIIYEFCAFHGQTCNHAFCAINDQTIMNFVQFMAKKLYILCHSWPCNHAFCGKHDQKIMHFVHFAAKSKHSCIFCHWSDFVQSMVRHWCILSISRPNMHALCCLPYWDIFKNIIFNNFCVCESHSTILTTVIRIACW
jgi:hypothetical protein